MALFDESGARTAAVGAHLLEVGVCLGPVRANLGRFDYSVGKGSLRLGEGGLKFFVFGHDLWRGVDCGLGCAQLSGNAKKARRCGPFLASNNVEELLGTLILKRYVANVTD
jgi:hypothetical protein